MSGVLWTPTVDPESIWIQLGGVHSSPDPQRTIRAARKRGSHVRVREATAPAIRWRAVTPDDVATLDPMPRALFVGGTGHDPGAAAQSGVADGAFFGSSATTDFSAGTAPAPPTCAG